MLNDLKIIQNKLNYRFSSDSILLTKFAKCKKNDFLVEFCSGSGVISIILNELYKPEKIIGFEIQNSLCDMANRSVELNKISNITFLNLPLNYAEKEIGNGKVDVVVCNPPYYLFEENKKINEKYKLAKYEVLTNLEDIFISAKKILKFSGRFYMVHIPERLQEILTIASKNNFECKKLKLVYSNDKKELSHLVLLCFVKGAKKGCEVLKPLYLS